MTIFVAADHGGYKLKERLKPFLVRLGHTVRDVTSKRPKPNDDYPSIALKAARAVARMPRSRGILLCRSGVGMEIVANRLRGIRAVNAWSPKLARRARQDEDTNVLSLAADLLSPKQAEAIVRAWLQTPFRAIPRYRRRLRMISRIGIR